jgi:hypothetical protein
MACDTAVHTATPKPLEDVPFFSGDWPDHQDWNNLKGCGFDWILPLPLSWYLMMVSQR